MRRRPIATVLLVLALLATACGARLSDEQREFALRSPGAESGAGGAGQAADGDQDGLATHAEGPDVSEGDGPEVGEGEGGGAAAGDGGGEDGAGGDGDGAEASDGGDGATDTRQAPSGGNGGETDTGVSEDEIVLANVSDISGAVPGIFEPEQLAAQAYVEFFGASEGTVYGRELSYLPLDGQLSSGANRAASIEACDRAFAAVGSMSAFDGGAAPVIDECGIPDIRTAATEPPMQVVDNAFPVQVVMPDKLPLGEWEWVGDEYPGAIENAAYIYIAGEVTEAFGRKARQATTDELGWDWTYVQEVDIAETNYAPFAREMEQQGVEYVRFQGDPSQAARLAEAMRQQGFEPDMFHLEANAYTPDLIERAPDAVEGTYVTIPSIMVEEAGGNEELQRYAQFLNQVAPGERPTSLGMYSWSAAKLFVEIAKEVGPELTREAMLEELSKVEGWDGGGLHPPIDVGAQEPSPCFIMVQVQNGEFTRVHPSEGFDCESPVAQVN